MAQEFSDEAATLAAGIRPLLKAAVLGHEAAIEAGLAEEERADRAADRAYWVPLRKKLERMPHS